MTREGTVVNGVIVLDSPPPFPEGTRVRVEAADDAELWDELADVPPPPFPPETREEFLASLRQAHADAKAGLGVPVAEAFARIRAELGLPAEGER